MFTWGLFQTDMTRKKEIPALRNEERGLLFCLIKSSRLESELVTYSNLDYVVVVINTVCNLSYTDVVTSIEYKVRILIRETYWYRKVECLNAFCVIFVYHETWLQTCLESKTLSYIVVQCYRYVDISWSPSYVIRLCSLSRVESANSKT